MKKLSKGLPFAGAKAKAKATRRRKFDSSEAQGEAGKEVRKVRLEPLGGPFSFRFQGKMVKRRVDDHKAHAEAPHRSATEPRAAGLSATGGVQV